jgi:hypothetical protein
MRLNVSDATSDLTVTPDSLYHLSDEEQVPHLSLAEKVSEFRVNAVQSA